MSKVRGAAAGAWVCALVSATFAAAEPEAPPISAEEFEAKLGYQTGTIELPGGIATIRLPESFRFIGAEGSRRLLVQGWGNPPGSADGVLGMMIPTSSSPLTEEGWGILITFDEDGFVNDDDAAKIDYTKMLKEMKQATVAANEQRKKQGFEPIELVGWAEPPSYDAASHKLYWAKELHFGDAPQNTLNYNIRILGRRGVLMLNAVSSMSQLEAIRGETEGVLAAVEFKPGHRYSDFLPGKDKAAAYGIGGLIAGAVAVKAGLLKALWLGILAFKKFILVGFVALAAWLKKLFSSRAQSKEPTPIESTPIEPT